MADPVLTPPSGNEGAVQGNHEVSVQPLCVAAVEVGPLPFQPRLCMMVEEDDLGSAFVVLESAEVHQRIH